MSNSTICYFGFGSLVNRDTRPASEKAVKATLRGWERHWAHHALGFADDSRSCCSLTVQQVNGRESAIDGVLVTIDKADLPELDKRETGYDRINIPSASFLIHDALSDVSADIAMYVSKPEHTAPADAGHPILQSYIDCVMAGFEQQFGVDGLDRLMRSTQGWYGPIENDRAHPRYPRAVTLASDVLARYDSLLERIRAEQSK